MDPYGPGPSTAPQYRLFEDNSDSDDFDATQTNDPIQDFVDDVSDYDNESLGSDFSDNVADIGTAEPVWSIYTAGLKQITFVKQPALLVPYPGERKPYDYFRLLFDDIFVENMVKFSNAYAAKEFNRDNMARNARGRQWKELTEEEFRNFIGLVFHTGTIKLNRIQDYWKTDVLFKIPVFGKVMARDRFMNIFRCLYARSPNHPENSAMDKIQFIVDHFNNAMFRIYYPDQELSLDEAMVLWRGRLHFRQYIKGKRHKYGVKLYSLTETTGLILKFHVYGGSTDELVGGKGHTEKVVLHLMKEKLGNGHSLYMDNFYNSFTLAAKLLANKTYCTGTLRLDRKFVPEAVKSAKLKKGEIITQYAESVMVGKWRDKRQVTYLSTQFENNLVDFINRRDQTVKKPLPIIQYNAYMSGVDRADQMMAYYPCERKTVRWYKKIIVHVIHMMLLNAHNLHNKYETKMTFYDFRLDVIRALLPSLNTPVETPLQKRMRLNVHKIMKSEERDTNNRLKRKNCRVCCRTQRNKKTPYFCPTCPDKPGLCLGQCFELYHA